MLIAAAEQVVFDTARDLLTGLIEFSASPDADRWRVEFRDNGIPQVIPPKRVDPHQRPRVHARFLTNLNPARPDRPLAGREHSIEPARTALRCPTPA